MGYCTVDDVCKFFSRFTRNQPGSVQDADIAGWIDDASSTVHSALYQRGLDCNNLSNPLISDPTQSTPVMDQPNVLRELARNYGIWRLASSIWTTLSPTEQSSARSSFNRWTTSLKDISAGLYDKLFWYGARTVDITPAFGGIPGADQPAGPHVSPPEGGSYPFWSGQVF